MPSYDYLCPRCGRQFEVFISYTDYDTHQVNCPHCKSDQVRQCMSRIRVVRSEETRLQAAADDFPALDTLKQDPKAIGRMIKRIGSQMGAEIPPEFAEVVQRLEAGQSTREITSLLPQSDSDDIGN